jgi:subfamily B ATP-binding cassette protein MsbA
MNHFRKILLFAKPYVRYAWLNTLFNILYAVFNILTVLSFLPVLSILFKTDTKVYEKPVYSSLSNSFDYLKNSFYFEITHYVEEKGVLAALGIICLVCVVLFFFKNLFRFLASYELAFLTNGIVRDLRNQLYRKIVRLPISYFSEKRKGDIISRMTADVEAVQVSFLSSLETVIREPLTILITLIMMFSMSAQLTLFVFIMLPVSGFFISAIGKKLKSKSMKAQEESGRFLSFIEETLTGLRVIKGFNAEEKMERKFNNSTHLFSRLMTNVNQRQYAASPTSEFLGALTIISILWFGGKLVLSNNSHLDAPSFFTYIGLFYSVLNPAKAISNAVSKIQKGDASAQRILKILHTENNIKETENAVENHNFEKEIVFKNISFKYQDEFVLKNFSLTIPKGKTVALVGQSGSGKSTLANLITRFYDVNEGTIAIDGINIKDFSKKALRSLMGIVTQDSILFNATVHENLALGVEQSTTDAVVAAAKIANAHAFIKDLPEGYNTNIGDNGNRLSGGQKQRLSIARAVLKNPPIMILDEATSALDTESEQLVQNALEKMMKNRTSMVIAHRLSTIQKADTIVVLHKGEISEQGTHEELISQKGIYYKLVNMQAL